MKYYDAFSAAGFHSAFLTTYAFGAQAFEDIALPRMWAAGCRNIHLIADEAMVNQEFSDIGPPRFAGTRYHLMKERRDGAFHPKLLLQLGREKARLLIGSANLTAPGLAGNLELVSSVECEAIEDPGTPIILSALSYIISSVSERNQWFETGLAQALEKTSWLLESDLPQIQAASGMNPRELLHDQFDRSVLQQFTDQVAGDTIERLSVISPYWDEELVALQTLKQSLGNPNVRVAIEPLRELFPRDAAHRIDTLSLYDLTAIEASRRVHAKLFVAEGTAHDHVLSGSMNCSQSALMHIGGHSRNAEAGLYTRLPAGTAIAAMGMEACFESALSLSDIPPYSGLAETGDDRLSAADGGALVKSGTHLIWSPGKPADAEGYCLSVFSHDGAVIAEQIGLTKSDNDHLHAHLPLDPQSACFGIIHFPEGANSAPVVISDLAALPKSAKEVARGRKAGLLSSLESVQCEDLQIIEILMDLESISEQPADGRGLLKRLRQRETNANPEPEAQRLSYSEFIKGRSANNIRPSHLSTASHADTYLSDVRRALNRIIGILGADEMTQQDLDDPEVVDLTPTEPTDEDPEEKPLPPPIPPAEPTEAPQLSRQARANTAERLVTAVRTFSDRIQKRRKTDITLADLVHLRALLQIILAFAIPKNAHATSQRVLPAYDKSSSDWPRLIGQVVQAFYVRGDEPFATLKVSPDTDRVPETVLECWAAVIISLRLALSVLKSEKDAGPIRTYLEKFQGLTATRINIEITSDELTNLEFEEFLQRFENRFDHLNYRAER